MHAENCNLMTSTGSFFDVTHTFKVGPCTYHVLGLRKDRPTYRNTYYVFNCTGDEHESTNESQSRRALYNRFPRASEQTSGLKHRPFTPHHRTNSANHVAPTHSRAHTEPAKKVEIDTTDITKTFTKIMKDERKLLVASLRKEMNIKKKSVIRSIKKEKEILLQATTEANNKNELIHILEEQKTSLTKLCETCINTTNSSIDALKQTLIETLDTQYNTSQSIEQLQLTLMQTIEEEVKKITLKNEEILSSTAVETNAIKELQVALIQKLESYPTTLKHDEEVLNNLFTEQNQILADAVVQQQQDQQTRSLDIIKQAMLDVIDEKQSTSTNVSNKMKYSQQNINDSITNISSDQILTSHNTFLNNRNDHSLPQVKSNQYSSKQHLKLLADQHLFKVSIRSPEPAHIFAELFVDGIGYSRRLYTLCQQDIIESDVFNCYIAPPNKDGPYTVTIYAKTDKDTEYQAAIRMRLPGSNTIQPSIIPFVHQSFEQHRCILIEPFRRYLRQNEQVLIHMIVPNAYIVKIQNGEDNIELDEKEYKNGVVKKKIRVRGDVSVIGCWDKKTDSIICVFNMIKKIV